jgi:hypothetical protein
MLSKEIILTPYDLEEKQKHISTISNLRSRYID